MLAVVTGGAGHLGTNLVTALRADGQPVRVVDMREPRTGLAAGATWVRADVRDSAAMRAAFTGAAVVYHLAGIISITGPRGGLVRSVNVDGAASVAEAALDAGVPRLVHCSSVHAFDVAKAAGAVDETCPRSLDPGLPAYDRSKAAGEERIRAAVSRGLDAVVVNPTGVIGPRDEAPSRVGAVLLALWRRRLPAVVAGGFDWVDVRDVAAGMRAAAARGRTGHSYLLPGHRLALRDLADLARACGGPVTRRCAPAWLARGAAPLCTVLVRATGSPLLPTVEAVRAVRAFPVVDGTKAARELGHRPRPAGDTIADLHAFFRETGRLPG